MMKTIKYISVLIALVVWWNVNYRVWLHNDIFVSIMVTLLTIEFIQRSVFPSFDITRYLSKKK